MRINICLNCNLLATMDGMDGWMYGWKEGGQRLGMHMYMGLTAEAFAQEQNKQQQNIKKQFLLSSVNNF